MDVGDSDPGDILYLLYPRLPRSARVRSGAKLPTDCTRLQRNCNELQPKRIPHGYSIRCFHKPIGPVARLQALATTLGTPCAHPCAGTDDSYWLHAGCGLQARPELLFQLDANSRALWLVGFLQPPVAHSYYLPACLGLSYRCDPGDSDDLFAGTRHTDR